uniref:ATP synthase complex subunit 8 n=1 Tax=Macrodon ancylodon TaxID=227978 RepID=C9D7F0_MACAC|nr:ATP synthase subunit 8 [Macrodon ancylodon]
MPQLDPTPWLAIMAFTWLVFLVALPPKIMAHLFSNEATSQDTETSKTQTWNWPWL